MNKDKKKRVHQSKRRRRSAFVLDAVFSNHFITNQNDKHWQFFSRCRMINDRPCHRRWSSARAQIPAVWWRWTVNPGFVWQLPLSLTRAGTGQAILTCLLSSSAPTSDNQSPDNLQPHPNIASNPCLFYWTLNTHSISPFAGSQFSFFFLLFPRNTSIHASPNKIKPIYQSFLTTLCIHQVLCFHYILH